MKISIDGSEEFQKLIKDHLGWAGRESISSKYGFQMKYDQFGNIVDENFEDHTEKLLIDHFEDTMLHKKVSMLHVTAFRIRSACRMRNVGAFGISDPFRIRSARIPHSARSPNSAVHSCMLTLAIWNIMSVSLHWRFTA